MEATQGFSGSVTRPLRPIRMRHAESEFEAIFLEHYERVLRILVRLVGSRAQAEELANEVFWKLSQQPASWLLANNVGGWLYRTATHAGIDALRSSANRRRYEEAAAVNGASHAETEAGPLNEILREEDRNRVRQAMSSMKPAQAQILLMRAGGSPYKELAEALDVAVTGIGTLLNRAETEFRKRYMELTKQKEKA